MNERGTYVFHIKRAIPKEKKEVPTEEENEEVFGMKDKELYDSLLETVKDPKIAKQITKICVEWADEQVEWGGKYDYLLEEIAGDDA